MSHDSLSQPKQTRFVDPAALIGNLFDEAATDDAGLGASTVSVETLRTGRRLRGSHFKILSQFLKAVLAALSYGALIIASTRLACSHGPVNPSPKAASGSFVSSRDASLSKAIKDLEKELKKMQVKETPGRESDDSACEYMYVCTNIDRWSSAKSVSLSDTFITDLSLRYLAKAQQLQEVNVDGTVITGAGLRYLLALPNLKTLNLGWCAKLRPKDCEIICQFPQVTCLDLSAAAIDDASLSYLARMKQLRRLKISHTRITGIGLRYLTQMRGLNDLDVFYCMNLTPKDFEIIGQMHSLNVLEAFNTHMTDVGLFALRNLKLKVLRASNTEITDKGLVSLKNMPINMLMVGRNQLTDEGVAELIDLPVQKLRLAGNTKITDRSIGSIIKMKSLTNLDIEDTGITKRGRRALEKAGIDINPHGVP